MNRFSDAPSTRRDLLAAAGAVGLGAAVPAPADAAAARVSLDLDDPAQRLKAFMMMRGALDESLVIGCISGRYYGVVENEIKPLYGVVAATFSRYRRAADGGYDGVSYEIPYFTDLATGEVMDNWLNPYTGQTVTVAHSGYSAAPIHVGRDLSISLPRPVPGLTVRHRVLPPQIVGDDVWLTEETMSELQIPGADKPIRYSELVAMHAQASDLAASRARRVPCQTNYTSIVSWRPWLKMGDHPGHLIGNGIGRYGMTLDELPEAWRRAVAARRPEALRDPGAALAEIWSAKP